MSKTIVGGKMMIGDQPLPLSKAVKARGEFVFMSGQLPLKDGKLVEGDITAQARQVLANVEAIAKEAGVQLSDIVKCTIWLADAADFAAFNAVYREMFAEAPPARSAIISGFVVPGALVEVEAIAVLPE